MATFNDDITQEMEGKHQNSLIPEDLAARLDARLSNPVLPQEEAPAAAGPAPERGIMGDIGAGLSDAPRQIVGGALDAWNNSLGKAGEAAWDWLGENWDAVHELHEAHPDPLTAPELEKSDSVTGGLIRSTSQFLTGFIPALKVAKLAGMSGLAANMVAGAGTDMAVFDPLEGRLSDYLNQVPGLKAIVPDYLASQEGDTEAEGRFKNALEGLALGGLTEGVFRAVKGFKALGKGADGTDKAAETGAKIAMENAAEPKVILKPVKDWTPKFKKGPNVEKSMNDLINGKDVDPEDLIEDFKMDNLTDDESLVNVFNTFSKHFRKQYDTLRSTDGSGVRKWNETKELTEMAKELGVSLDDIRGIYKDVEHLDVEVTLARSFMKMTGNEVKKMTQLIIDEGADSTENLMRLKHRVNLHNETQGLVKGIQTNVARATRAMGIGPEGLTLSKDVMDLALDANGGPKTLKSMAEKISDLIDDPAKANRFMREASKASKLDVIQYYWINSILSGPSTHMVNITSNALALGMDVVETAGAATKTFLTGRGEVTFAEAASRMQGMFLSFFDAFKMAGRAFKKGEGQIDVMTKFDTIQHAKPISGQALGLQGTAGHAADLLGTVVGLPGRALVTMDEFFKTMALRSELYGLAARNATGTKGITRSQLIAKYMDKETIPKDIQDQLLKKARLLTFQEELGDKGKSFMRFLQQNKTLRFAVPFVRTPVNLLKYVTRRTPGLHMVSSSIKADIAAGGARAEIAKARLATGTMLYGVGTMLASQGIITGGSDPKNRDANRNINRASYSVKIGDKSYSFSRMDPFGMFFGLCADMVEVAPHISEAEYDEFVSGALIAISRNVVSKTYLKGLTDMLNVIADPQRNADYWVKNFAGSFIPNFLNQYNKAEHDNEIKEVMSMRDALFKRIPGLSKHVYAKRHAITGEKIVYGDSGRGGLLPTYITEETKHVGLQEMHRLGMGARAPRPVIDGIELKPDEYDEYQKTVTSFKNAKGQNMSDRLIALVGSDYYKSLPDGDSDTEGKKGAITKLMRGYTKYGKEAYKRSNERVLMELANKKQ